MAAKEWVGKPLLDIASYAKRGPGERIHLTRAELELIRRTVTRTPEVMVKVLTQGGQNLKAVRRHMNYLSRGGDEPIHTDDGQIIQGKEAEARLLKDWDLDLEEYRRSLKLVPTNSRAPPKLVLKVLFSMPPGTPPDKLLQATQNFAREQFGLQHRYAMVLHTDEPHPHVHMVLKALNENGKRLNIKKATLREWRSEFARHLRDLGVPANATERIARGEVGRTSSDGLFRARQRGASLADVMNSANSRTVKWNHRQMTEVQMAWRALAGRLSEQGNSELAEPIERFNSGIGRSMSRDLAHPRR